MITCTKCGIGKDEEAFPFVKDDFDIQREELGRTEWCSTYIDGELAKRNLSPSGNIAIAGTTTRYLDGSVEPTMTQKYYIEHKEARRDYARARYWRLKGHPVPPKLKRVYTKRLIKEGDPSLPTDIQARLEEERLKQTLLSRMNWVEVCWRTWREQLIPDNAEVAAGDYSLAVRDEEKVRERLGIPFRKLSGDPVVDAILFGEENTGKPGENEGTK